MSRKVTMQLEAFCSVSHRLAVGIRSAVSLVAVWSEFRWTSEKDQMDWFAPTRSVGRL